MRRVWGTEMGVPVGVLVMVLLLVTGCSGGADVRRDLVVEVCESDEVPASGDWALKTYDVNGNPYLDVPLGQGRTAIVEFDFDTTISDVEDNRRISNGQQYLRMAEASLRHPPSLAWTGYWQRHQAKVA